MLGLVHHRFIEGEDEVGVGVDFFAVGAAAISAACSWAVFLEHDEAASSVSSSGKKR